MCYEIKKATEHPFGYMLSIARVTDNSDGMVLLYNKGVEIACIRPETSDYWNLKDVIREFLWEDFPNDTYNDECFLYYNDVVIKFDSFCEYYI